MLKFKPLILKWNKDKILQIIIYLFSFVIIIDPPNTFFHLKDLLFIILLIICILRFKPNYYLLSPFFIFIIIWLISSQIGYSSDKIKDIDFNLGIFKTFLPFILLGWIKNLNFTQTLVFPCILISVISILVAISMLFLPELEIILYDFFTLKKDLMLISRRSFIGFELVSAFYRSTPVIIIPLSQVSYQYFINKNKDSFKLLIILFFGLFFGGNRACILSALAIPICFFLYKLYREAKIYRFLSSLFILIVSSFSILIMLLSDVNETSNEIKYGHLNSYIDYFNNNLSIFFFGYGPGSQFFSSGFGHMTSQTEWTYIELIRYFGIIGSLGILIIYTFPLIKILLKKWFYPRYFCVLLGYSYYLILSGTNPLLLSSSGLIVCLWCYSMIYYKNEQ